ncbi:protoporphyrinogen oxidase HemJ [Entomobacter blattae]|uniref:Protoporphyrinogen IX oxidase n=1 Tax=Entomobacter blattae TaxID=2762277 RepID=A0A7H1NPV3_9PROT|nr:protoporphyrinogen oxidase HemJ [Entomobacter blattae]QNT77813.1 hypothetical protein JGUZn3_05680 [Entomobacter blattae]
MMSEFLITHYLWIKSFHVISVIAWMAGQFYLPRLFVYHCQVQPGTAEDARFKIMERRLQRAIINPAIGVAFLCGIFLVLTPGLVDWRHFNWWYVKFFALMGLFWFHGACSKWRRHFEKGINKHPEKFYRFANEIPTIFMIIIVIMVIVKPF